MKIYKYETKAGLQDKLLSDNVIAYCVPAISNTEKNSIANPKLDIALAQNNNQRDLYYIDSVLVSTNWNLNDDVFDPEEVWKARHTPEDKQFNLNHDEKQIVGHITKNTTVTYDGQVITSEEMPENFEILTSSVIYTRWTDTETRDLIFATIDEIEKGEWAVSMECIFNDFDYAVQDGDEIKVVARDDDSSFLTKHLRCYGGSGVFEGYKIGRLLRNIVFSGVGLVRNPANKRSVIKNSYKQVANVNDIFKGEEMSDELKNAQELLVKANEAVKSNEVLITELKSASEAKDGVIESLKVELKEAKSKISEFEKKIAVAARTNQLAKLGLSDADVSAMIEKFAGVNDETFAEIVKIKAEALEAMKYEDKDKEEDEEEEDDTMADVEDAVAEESDDLGVADEQFSEIAAASEYFKKVLSKNKGE